MSKQRARAATPAGKATAKPGQPNAITAAAAFVEPAKRSAMIAEAAYYRAERRAFCPGRELDDWLAAETEVDQTLASERETAAVLE